MHSLVRDHMIRLSNVYTSLRQASEWGIVDYRGPSLDAKNVYLWITESNTVSLSVLFWFIIFVRRLSAVIRLRQCLIRSTRE
jgi:hypothetical protein